MNLSAFLQYVIIPMLSLSLILMLIRLYKAPHVVDRVIALDLVITIGIGLITAYSIATEDYIFLDVAMILALIAFLGTIAFSYYLEKKGKR